MDAVDVPTWSCTLAYPEGWIEVPLDPEHVDPDDPQALVDAVAARVHQLPPTPLPLSAAGAPAADGAPDPPPSCAAGGIAGALGTAGAVEVMAAVLADDVARGAVLGAHRYQYDPHFGHVHAHLTVWVELRRHPGSLVDELAALLDLTQRVHSAVEEPEVDEVSLPHAGRSLRVRFLEAERIGRASDGSEASANRAGGHAVDNDDGEANDTEPNDIYAVLVDTVTYLVPVQDTAYCLWLRFWTPHLATSEQLVGEFDSIAQALVVDPGGGALR